MSQPSALLLERKGGVLHVRLHRPQVRNAMSQTMLVELLDTLAQAEKSGKPAHIAEKMVKGKLKKWAKEICLYEQPFIKEDKKTIDQVRTALIAKTGENVSVRRFVRWEVGEGLEKRKNDLAAEVAEELAKHQ